MIKLKIVHNRNAHNIIFQEGHTMTKIELLKAFAKGWFGNS